MEEIQMHPIQSISKKRASPGINLILILDILCSICSLFTIIFDVFAAAEIYAYDNFTGFLIYTIFSLIKYSSIIYNWVIYGVYERSSYLSKCFKIASIIILIIYMLLLVPYLIYLFSLILSAHTKVSVSEIQPFYLYLVAHMLFIFSLVCSLRFVILQNQNSIFQDDLELKYFTRIER